MPSDRGAIDTLKADKSRLLAALTDAGGRIVGSKIGCPFHPDEHPSGGVHEHNGSGWLYTCHGCRWNGDKNTGDILDVVQRHHGCDFPRACELLGLSNGRTSAVARPTACVIERSDAGPTDHSGPSDSTQPWSVFPTVEAAVESVVRKWGGEHGGSWTYQNADGSPAMMVVRVNVPDGGKQFRPLHPVDGGWAIADPPGPLPLYGLPQLNGPDRVSVVEGEKCVEAARSIGLVATTSSHGSGGAGKTDWTPLAGREVVILPDHDGPGQKYAEHVAKILAGLNPPARTSIVELPDLPEGGDIVDYIDARECADPADIRHGIEALIPDPWRGTSVGELWRSDRLWKPVRYVPTGLRWLDSRLGGGLRTRGVHTLAGKTGHAKSQLAAQVAANAARGGVPVGFFSLELGSDEVAQLVAAQLGDIPRLALATGQLDAERAEKLRGVMTEHGTMPLTILDDERWERGLTREALAELVAEGVRRFAWQLVVVDYLGLLVPSEDDRDQFDTDVRHSTALKKLAQRQDIALVVVAAVRKGATHRESAQLSIDDLIGAGRLAYDAQTVVVVSRAIGEADCGLVKVRPLKLRFAPCDDNAPDVQLRWRPRSGRIVDLEGAELEAIDQERRDHAERVALTRAMTTGEGPQPC